MEGVADIVFGVSAYTPALFPKTMLAILPGTSKNADQSTRAIWEIYEDHLADEYDDVKVLAIGTVAGNLLAATRDVSTHIVENVPTSFAVTYAVMNMERYMGLSDEHRAIVDELSGLPMSLELAKSFDGADDRSKAMIADAKDKKYEWIVVSDEERAKMDAAVETGLEAIFADYEERGIADARGIYDALND